MSSIGQFSNQFNHNMGQNPVFSQNNGIEKNKGDFPFHSHLAQDFWQELRASQEKFNQDFQAILAKIRKLQDWQKLALAKFILKGNITLSQSPNSPHRFCFKDINGKRLTAGKEIGDIATELKVRGWQADSIVFLLDGKVMANANQIEVIIPRKPQPAFTQLSFEFN